MIWIFLIIIVIIILSIILAIAFSKKTNDHQDETIQLKTQILKRKFQFNEEMSVSQESLAYYSGRICSVIQLNKTGPQKDFIKLNFDELEEELQKTKEGNTILMMDTDRKYFKVLENSSLFSRIFVWNEQLWIVSGSNLFNNSDPDILYNLPEPRTEKGIFMPFGKEDLYIESSVFPHVVEKLKLNEKTYTSSDIFITGVPNSAKKKETYPAVPAIKIREYYIGLANSHSPETGRKRNFFYIFENKAPYAVVACTPEIEMTGLNEEVATGMTLKGEEVVVSLSVQESHTIRIHFSINEIYEKMKWFLPEKYEDLIKGKTYVINLKNMPEKYMETQRVLSENGFKNISRFVTESKTDLKTHQEIWNNIIERDLGYGIIFVDNIELHSEFKKIAPEIWNKTPKDVGLIFLGSQHISSLKTPIISGNRIFSSCSYIISRDACAELLSRDGDGTFEDFIYRETAKVNTIKWVTWDKSSYPDKNLNSQYHSTENRGLVYLQI